MFHRLVTAVTDQKSRRNGDQTGQDDAELGVLAVSDVTLGRMKREKLLAKQRLQRMFESPASTSSPTH